MQIPQAPIAPISVVIPAYNAEKYLRQAIRSVQNQTVKVSEIIVVDDNSTDRTPEIAGEMGVIVLPAKGKNQGEAAARNRGIRASNFDWIAFLDADDYWDKRKIGYQWQAIQARPEAGMVSCFIRTIYDKSATSKIEREDWFTERNYEHSQARTKINRYCSYFDGFEVESLKHGDKIPSSVVINRRVFEKIGMFDETLSHGVDTELFLRVLHKFPWSLVHRVLVSYRRHSSNMTTDQSSYIGLTAVSLVERISKSPEKYPTGCLEQFGGLAKNWFIKRGLEQAQKKKR